MSCVYMLVCLDRVLVLHKALGALHRPPVISVTGSELAAVEGIRLGQQQA